MSKRAEKLILGPRVKRLRQSLGLTQAQMAADLGVSPSYVNLIEANQRPISAKLLIKLAQVYDVNLADLSEAGDSQLRAELASVLKDPVLEVPSLGRAEVEDVVNASPEVARALIRLHGKYRTLALSAYSESNPLSDREKVEVLEESARPVEAVRAHFYANRNYFDALDRAAEGLAAEIGLNNQAPHTSLTDRLRDRHGITVRILPHDVMPSRLRYFDPHRKHLNLSELLPQSGRRFQIAVHLGLLEHFALIEQEVIAAGLEDSDARGLARVSFANYFAAALVMPYGRFLAACEQVKYDVELLSHRFGTSYEQTAHRLTTLQRPEARGVPFFFVRIDRAGNVSKRFSAGRFHFSKFGGTCPLWNIHSCFEVPDQVQTQVIRMPDDTTYLSIAKTVMRSSGTFDQPASKLAIGLGCDIAYAPRLIQARHLDLAAIEPTPVGVNCYLCERQNCASRAHAPINRKLAFNERERGVSIFQFEDK